MNGQISDLMKQRKEKAWPNPQRLEKLLESPGKELDQDIWEFPGAWDPRDMQQTQVGIKTVQGDIPRNTRNYNRYVPISHPMMQKRNQKAWESTTHE